MIPLNLPTRSRRCTRCDGLFEPGDEYTSTLIQPEERSDYCQACLEEGTGVAQWRGRVPARPKKVEPKGREERAMDWLHKALAEGNAEEAYVLCLYLQRRKKLRFVKEHNGEQVFECGNKGATLTVPCPPLEGLAVEQLQATIAEKLQGNDE
jgi:hypothetical protein